MCAGRSSCQHLCQDSLAAGGSALRLQASRETKHLEEEAALGPKNRVEVGGDSTRGHANGLEPGSPQTSIYRRG